MKQCSMTMQFAATGEWGLRARVAYNSGVSKAARGQNPKQLGTRRVLRRLGAGGNATVAGVAAGLVGTCDT